MANAHTLQDLKIMQALPLEIKVRMTQDRIRGWVNEFGVEGVYVSFSGGKDSTVLLDLVRNLYPEVPAVFVDTGLEYPEIREFVKTFDNVTWVKPKMNFKEVVMKYGYPFISKEVSEAVYYARRYVREVESGDFELKGKKQQVKGSPKYADLVGVDRRNEKDNEEYQKIKQGRPTRVKKIFGELEHTEKGVLTDEYSKQYDLSKYKFFLDAPFEINNRCCYVMKKAPAKKYGKETGRKPFTGTTAEESMLRQSQWVRYGCNMFEAKNPISNPLSFWTNNDILQYIKEHNLPICSVYGEIVETYDNQMQGQMSFDELKPHYKTTGCDRTGCMFCGYGCQMKSDQRFVLMKDTHPKQYEWIMKPVEQGGMGYKEIIDWINEHGNLKIKY